MLKDIYSFVCVAVNLHDWLLPRAGDDAICQVADEKLILPLGRS